MYKAAERLYVGTLEERFGGKSIDASTVRDWGTDELPAIRKFTRLMSLIDAYRQYGPVLVQCEQGRSRAPTLVRMYCESRSIPYSLMEYNPSDYMKRVFLRWSCAA